MTNADTLIHYRHWHNLTAGGGWGDSHKLKLQKKNGSHKGQVITLNHTEEVEKNSCKII